MKTGIADLILSQAMTEGKAVEDAIKTKPEPAKVEDGADAIHLEDFATGADGHSHAVITPENIGRLAKQGFVKFQSKKGNEHSSLKECIEEDVLVLREAEVNKGYAENKSGHFKLDMSKEDAGHLYGHHTPEAVESNVTDAGDHYLVKSGEDTNKVEKSVQFKLSRGNIKVGGNTVILNMSSAKDCMSAILGLCELYAKGQCYAVNGEYRDTVLSAKRMQGISFKKLAGQDKSYKSGEYDIENTALGLGILTTVASLSNWKSIKYVRLNESGDFRDEASSETLDAVFAESKKTFKGILDVTAKKKAGKKLSKEESEVWKKQADKQKYLSSGKYLNTLEDDIRKKLHDAMAFPDTVAVTHVLETWKACASHGTKAVFEASMGSVEDFGVSTDELFTRCDQIVKDLAIYTYTHRTDLESKFAKICADHSNFSLNGSLKRFNPKMNMFRAVDYEIFTKIFGQGGEDADRGNVKPRNFKTLSPEAQESLKPFILASEVDGTTSSAIYPCKQSCRICDFCKKPHGGLIFIPIHGSGSTANSMEKEINELVKKISGELMSAVNSNNPEYADLDELLNTYHTSTDSKAREDAKHEIKTKYFPKMFEKFVAGASTTKENKSSILGAFNALVYEGDRFDRFFDALVSGGSNEVFNIIKDELTVSMAQNHPVVAGQRLTGAVEAIKQTYVFLNPESEGFKAISAKIEEFESVADKADEAMDKFAKSGEDIDAEAVKKTTAPLLDALTKIESEVKSRIASSKGVKKGIENSLTTEERNGLTSILVKLDLEKKFLQGVHENGVKVDTSGISGKATKLDEQARNADSLGDKASAKALRQEAYTLLRDAGDKLVRDFSSKFSLIGDVDKQLSQEANLFVENIVDFANKIHTAVKVGSANIWYNCLRDAIGYISGEKNELTTGTRAKLGKKFAPKAKDEDGLAETIIHFTTPEEAVNTINESKRPNAFQLASDLID